MARQRLCGLWQLAALLVSCCVAPSCCRASLGGDIGDATALVQELLRVRQPGHNRVLGELGTSPSLEKDSGATRTRQAENEEVDEVDVEEEEEDEEADEKVWEERLQSLRPSKNLPAKFDGLRGKEAAWSADEVASQAASHRLTLHTTTYNETFTWSKNDAPLKVVLGVMSLTTMPSVREAHRRTWMAQEGVCHISRWAEEGCHIFPVFVFGNVSRDALQRTDSRSDDAVILEEIPEPTDLSLSGFAEDGGKSGGTHNMWQMSQLKTPGWFRYAAEHYKWATHVGKMDLDTYPHIPLIRNDLLGAPRTGLYYGRRMDKKGHLYRLAIGGHCGEFYLVSADLLGCWSESEQKRAGRQMWLTIEEDQVFSMVLQTGERDHMCPRLTWLDISPGQWRHPV